MRKALQILVLLGSLGVAGCNDTSQPHDVTPPAAPRGLFSVTGDGQVTLNWLANTESDLSGYRVYESPCSNGPNCPYDRIGATATTQFVVSGLANGVTRFYAISSVDKAGNESDLSFEDVFDTPRPAGGTTLHNYLAGTANTGWDFSAFAHVSSIDPPADMFYGNNGAVAQMFCTAVQLADSSYVFNDIQDAGYASSLDAVDVSPQGQTAGWSPTGSVELIPGHCYIVWTWDDHYAKFRVTGISVSDVSIDWAYQTAVGNPELRNRPVHTRSSTPRPVAWLR